MIVVITPTGDRPEAFALCCKYMMRQTIFPNRVWWVIVTDGRDLLKFPDGFTESAWCRQTCVIQRPPRDDGQHTLNANLLLALDAISQGRPHRIDTSVFTIWEDDEWYHPERLARVEAEFSAGRSVDGKNLDLMGESPAIFYNVRERRFLYQQNANTPFLGSMSFSPRILPHVVRLLKEDHNPSLDYRLWKWANIQSHDVVAAQITVAYDVPAAAGYEPRMVVGIKGLPGRPGSAPGHRITTGYYPDPDGEILRQLIGADADDYDKYVDATNR